MNAVVATRNMAPFVHPSDYERTWAARKPGTSVRDQLYYFAVYASAYFEDEHGVEIEVSALVDLRPGHRATTIDDYRCRVVPDGAEVDVDDAKLEELHDELVDAALRAVR